MKVLNNIVRVYMVALVSVAIVSGCATNLVNLVDTKKVVIGKTQSNSAYFSKHAVYSTDIGTIVSGELFHEL